MNTDEARRNGKKLRKTCKRSSHGKWKYRKDRDHIIELLKEQEKTRIQELIPVRHERMSASPFAFYRNRQWEKRYCAGLSVVSVSSPITTSSAFPVTTQFTKSHRLRWRYALPSMLAI